MNSHINILKKSNDKNKLTIFVGSGISASSKLPLWSDLIKMIKYELGITEKETDYLKIAQLYYLSCGETVYYQRIRDFFPENIEPTVIQKLIFELKPANIITTNWDTLLEKTARDNGYIYDVISKDEHLVQSELENHIIKMHGDFRDNNIVFKEDDYINYKYNFPLIENFIKSVLSTNTILFLGYSYSDINLKQISKWIQNNSKSMPAMFLVVFKEDKNQSKYLENFGIKTIIVEKEDKKFGLDSYSNKMATFLSELNLDIDYYSSIDKISDLEIVNFIYNKLKPLNELEGILLNQLQKTLTNCGFNFIPFTSGNYIFLEFYDTLSTYDFDQNIRKIYNKFRNILNNLDNGYSQEIKGKIFFIISILYKSNINGYIKISDKNIIRSARQNEEFALFKIPKKVDQYKKHLFNFTFNDFEVKEDNIKELREKTFFYYQKYEYNKAFNLNEKVIKLCLKQQNYIQLFLAMFNHNILLYKLQDSLYLEDISEKYKYQVDKDNMHSKVYNLDEKFYELPKTIQKVLSEIKPFLSYDYLYRFSSEVDDELDKKNKQKKAIENNSGMSWETNVTRNYSKQKNLIYFVLNNLMMIERIYEFNNVNKKLIRISLIRQMQKKYFTLDKLELFVVIKYISSKDLFEIINDFKDFKLKIEMKILNWLTIKIFSNIVKLYIENKTLNYDFNDEIIKILYLSSMNLLSKKQLSIMLKQIKILINCRKINLDIYEFINRFVDSQMNIDKKYLIEVIEMMIDKIICNKANMWDYEVIEKNYFWSPFKHLGSQDISYENIDLIKKFLHELNEFNNKQKIQLSRGFLFNLYLISNEEIKELIKDFILSINLDDINESNLKNLDINNTQDFDFNGLINYGLKISFKLFLAIQKFIEIDDQLIKEIKKYPEEDKDSFYFLGEITGQVRYLVEQMDIKKFEDLLKVLLKTIDEANAKQKNINKMII